MFKLLLALWPLYALIAIVYLIRYLPYIIKYKKSNYKIESNVGLLQYLMNIGYFGEALTFFVLEKLPVYSKIMTNLYIPTEEGTTEIDLLFICSFGIYVIESKNYSGWIFGSENSKNWTSIIYKTKNKFLNPIWQNKKHIKYLNKILNDVELKSLIVFSERCEFKKLNLGNSIVIKRNELKNTILKDSHNNIYSNEQIDAFYSLLQKYSNKTEKEKREHIDYINNNL